jgi:hypothetical protein
MSDSEDYATTEVVVEKPKKERTEAQKRATAKALETLAQRRAEKKAEKAVVKRTTRTTTTVMKAKPKATPKPPPIKNELVLQGRAKHYIEEDEEDEEAHPYKPDPRPSKAKTGRSAITHNPTRNPSPPPRYDDDIRYLKEGLLGITGYIEEREQRKAQRKQKKRVVVEDSESSDTSDDEPPAPARKKRVAKSAPPTNQYNGAPDPQEVLRSIFWR